jgi:phage tail sheath protein FI
VSDAEVVEHELILMPGIVNTALNDHMIQVAEDRGDTLAIIDLPSAYTPRQDNGKVDVRFTPTQTITEFRSRGVNSSYACAYFPWVQIRDTINNQVLWAPPSVVALGVMSSAQKKTEPWFAPAGFNRGGLNQGAAGIPVTNIREKLSKRERDDLYEANINPIASFPAEGLVVFGQKTLQLTRSALDRINVRRLLLFVKRGISRIANGILFDQNIEITWSRFRAQADRFLSSVQTRLGLEAYKFLLDETTTTPDLVDRNVLYAKVFLKPARSIEFIAVDFNITNSGASFVD